MKNKLKIWNESKSWDEAESEWEAGKQQAAESMPLKSLKQLPKLVGITKETAKGLKWKSLKWMIKHDHKKEIRLYLSKRIGQSVRVIPEIAFFPDDSAVYAQYMDKVISDLNIPPAPPEEENEDDED